MASTDKPQKNQQQDVKSRIISLLRAAPPTSGDASVRQPATSLARMNSFSPIEIEVIDRLYRAATPAPNSNISGSAIPPTTENLFGQAMRVSQEIKRRGKSATALAELTPEVGQATQILVSSIISPMDMQTGGKQTITCTSTDLTEEQRTVIGKKVTDAIHERYELGPKFPEWYRTMYFVDGATCIAVLPTNLRDQLLQHYTTKYKRTTNRELVATEEFNSLFSSEFQQMSFDEEEIGKVAEDVEWTSLLAGDKLVGDVLHQVALERSLIPLNELRSEDEKVDPAVPAPGWRKYETELLDYVTGTVRKLLVPLADRKTQAARSPLSVSMDPSHIMRASRDAATEEQELFDDLFEQFDGGTGTIGANRTLRVDDSEQSILSSKTPPMLLELPTSSVIPVSVPGNPKQHIAYFVMIDEYGNPYVPADSELHSVTKAHDTLIDEASRVYEQSSDKLPMGGNMVANISKAAKTLMLNAVFNVSLKRMLQSKIRTLGFGDIDLPQQSAIATSIFYRLLHHQEVRLVFIPASLMVYYAVDYHEDGTGKALLDDVSQILSLRATLIVANVMSAMQNAIRHHRIFVDLDSESSQAEGILQLVQKWFIEKHELTYADSIPAISQSILSRAVQVIPRYKDEQAGAAELNIEHETETGRQGIQETGTEMIDTLTQMAIGRWNMPYSAFNQLRESEFSRSVAANSLMFSNFVRGQQYLVSKANHKLVRLIAAHDPVIRTIIRNALQLGNAGDVLAKTTEQGGAITDERAPANEAGVKLLHAIRGLQVILPPPNILIDKSVYSEISDFVRVLSELAAARYPDSLAGKTEDGEPLVDMEQVRAIAMSMTVRDYLSNLSTTAFRMPEFGDLLRSMTDEVSGNAQLASNMFAGMTRNVKLAKNALTNAISGTPTDEANPDELENPDESDFSAF